MSSILPNTDRYLLQRRRSSRRWGILLFLLCILVFASGYVLASLDIKPSNLFQAKKAYSPYHAYVHRLQHAGLDTLPLGQAWLAAGKAAMEDSQLLDLPVQMETLVEAARPSALSFRFEAKEGERVHVQVDQKAGDTGQLFVEIFQVWDARQLPKVILSDIHLAGEIQFDVPDEGVYLLRIQPELLVSMSFRLQLYKTPSLAFPVHGKDRKAIMSFFGAPRDGGRRKHKGVDIFAAKGTPILAAASGRVHLRNGGLGGKTVWQRANGMSLYYAHLDSQYVRSGQQVRVGDVLGTVGNTGNARSTPPHLHFGIYQRGKGALNPLAFIDTDLHKPSPASFGRREGQWGRVLSHQADLHGMPKRNAVKRGKVKKNEALLICADLGKWLWVEKADRQKSFIESQHVTSIDKVIGVKSLDKNQAVFLQADSCAAVKEWKQQGEEIAFFAETDAFYLTQNAGQWAWVQK